jgi:hypothetical protein
MSGRLKIKMTGSRDLGLDSLGWEREVLARRPLTTRILPPLLYKFKVQF